MRVIRLQVGPLATNAYVAWDGSGPECVVIDPGAEGERIVARCRAEGLTAKFIVNTHAHVDHIGANAELKRAFPDAVLCIGERDAPRLGDAAGSLAAMFGVEATGQAPDLLLHAGQRLSVGAVELTVLETPGHTPGAICLLRRDGGRGQLFSGDLVFRGSVGRTDLPGGSEAELWRSVRTAVLPLPDDTIIWPGHGEPTTLGEERAWLAAAGQVLERERGGE